MADHEQQHADASACRPGIDYHGPTVRTLVAVFGCLIVLTAITVAARSIDLGPANVVVALAIALAKTALVAMVFMHLRWDSPFNALILVAAFFFVAVFIALSAMDTVQTADTLAGR